MFLYRALLITSLFIGCVMLFWGIQEPIDAFVPVGGVIVGWAVVLMLWAYVPGVQQWWETRKASAVFMRWFLIVVMLISGVGLLVWGIRRASPLLLLFGLSTGMTPVFFTTGSWLTRRLMSLSWNGLAQQAGLAFQKKPLSVTGTYRGRVLRMDRETLTQRMGRKQYEMVVTRITFSVNNRSRAALRLHRPAFFRLRDRHSVSGDPDFDRRFVFNCEPEDFAGRLFVFPSLRGRLARIPAQEIRLIGQQLRCRQSGAQMLQNVDSLRELLDVLCDLAESIETFG
jgi:hypothetical protein